MTMFTRLGIKSLLDQYNSFFSNFKLVDAGDCKVLAESLQTAQGTLTATVGGTAANSKQLSLGMNRVDTSTGANTDSVVLPPAIPGSVVYLENNTANTIVVFGAAANQSNLSAAGAIVADTITAHNALSGAAAASQNQATTIFAQYTCIELGNWKQGLMT